MRKLVFVLLVLGACARATSEPEASKADASSDAAAKTSSADLVGDGGAAEGPRPRGELVKIAAVNQVSVSSIPAWPETQGSGARRLGYLRHGTVVEAYESALINDECKEGWFELANDAGWVCSKYATVDLQSPRVRLAPHQPDRDAGMPYRYGINVGDGTPLYRRVLAADDRRKFEHIPEEKKDREKDDEVATIGVDEEAIDAGPPVKHADLKDAKESKDAKDAKDAGVKEKPRLRDLKGRGVLVRKMSRGFLVALDRDFKAAGTRWWRTTFGFAVPFDKIVVQQAPQSKHTGNWFLDAARAQEEDAPPAVLFVRHSSSIKFTLNEDATKVLSSAELPKRSAVALTGRKTTIGGVVYEEAVGGSWVLSSPLVAGKPEIPADLAPNEKWIDVDLTRQTLIAFEGKRPVFATLISSGRRNPQDKEKDFPTPTGSFRIGEKHITTTMDGDVASDGPYSIEDVPWVQYFQGSYALHGAFWHDNFGYVRSHGCVNLAPDDARTLFSWTEPKLPEGWHGVFAQPDKGTRVVIHEDDPKKEKKKAAAAAASASSASAISAPAAPASP